jgi:hypothetical protein
MYLLPLILLLVAAIALSFWAPIFAVVIFALGFVFFLAVIGLRRRADQRDDTPERDPLGTSTPDVAPERAGMWGEKDAEGGDTLRG